MQIVIDISDELKNKIDACDDDSYSSIIRWYDTTLYDAIRNGTPLPKGHGRLIDADELKEEYPHNTDWDYPVNTNSYVVESIDNSPTIIEADKEKERK